MRTLLFITLFISSFLIANSQVPGYLGKRLSISATELIGSPTWGQYSPRYGPESIINIHTFTRIAGDYAVGNKTMLGLSCSFGSMGFYDYINDYPLAKLNATAIEVHTKLFLGDHIAPLGKFISLGLAYQRMKETDPLNYSVNYGFKEYSSSFFTFHLGFGANFFINDFLYFTPSLETNLHFQDPEPVTIDDYIANRWQRSSYALFGIGVGVLVF